MKCLLSLFFLIVCSLCNAMDQNPTSLFPTSYGNQHESEEAIAQVPLSETVFFITEETDGSFKGLQSTPRNLMAEGKLQLAFDLKNFVRESLVKDFIISEYKKDENCIPKLVDTVLLMKKRCDNHHLSDFFSYKFGEQEYYQNKDTGIVCPALDFEKFIHNPEVKEYIVAEYKKDPVIIRAFVDKILVVTEKRRGMPKHFLYTLGNAEYYLSKDGCMYPGIDFEILLANPGVQEYVHAHYPMKKSFIQKYPKTSVIGAAGLGVLTVGALWWLKTK